MPIVPVNLALAVPVGTPALYAPAAVTNYNTTLAEVQAVPGYANVTLDDNGSGAARFTTARYEGGPFVIDVTDALKVINFLKTDASMAPFRTACTGGANPARCDGQAGAGSGFSATIASACHFVNLHMNTVEFTAPVYRRITNVPPHIGVLTNGPGVKGDMLPKYMASAGLDFTGAIGCPPGHPNCPTGTSTVGIIYDRLTALDDIRSLDAAEATALNNGTAAAALPDGLINALDVNSDPYYQVLWTPHWEIGQWSSGAATTDCDDVRQGVYDGCRSGRTNGGNQPSKNNCNSLADSARNACNVAMSTIATTQTATHANGVWGSLNATTRTTIDNSIAANFPVANSTTLAQVESGLTNVAKFTDRRGTGLFAECASVSTFETSFIYSFRNSNMRWVEPSAAPHYSTVPRFMYTNGIQINGLGSGTNANCTDPNYVNGDCILYPVPGNAFSQIGDFQFTSAAAHTIDWIPLRDPASTAWQGTAETGGASALRNGALILARSWTNFQGSTEASALTGPWVYRTPDEKDGWTFFSLMQKDNDPQKAMILYLGGHEFSNSPAGTRIALNTLLNLGADPIRADRSLTSPVAFDDVNGSIGNGDRALTFSSTFQALSGVLPEGAEVFHPNTGSQWIFPLMRGDVRAHSLDGANQLATGESALNDGLKWSADAKLPLPDNRNVFTYVGGALGTTPTAAVRCDQTGTCTPLGTGLVPANGIIQTGWVPAKFAVSELVAPTGAAPVGGCVDVVSQANKRDNLDHQDKFGFAAGADGICDIQQLMQYTELNPDASGHVQAPDIANLTADLPELKHIVAIVRGHCYATVGKIDAAGAPNYSPTNAQCNSSRQSNVAHLGGLVNSTAAVVPASTNVPANCSSGTCTRPTVAYVGAHDGQLHAIYVSGGANYIAPATPRNYPNPPAHTAFSVSIPVGGWSPPQPGTELWSFIPSSQLPFLSNNNAKVDSSMLVQDVFADFVGNGKREWHTVLVGSVGPDSRELFAFDITDPLRPVLLWDVVGSTRRTGGNTPRMASVAQINDDQLPGHFKVFGWNGSAITTTFLGDPAEYKLPPQPDDGRRVTGAFDYSTLGGTASISMGLIRVGLNPVYAVFVASSSSALQDTPTKGLMVYAIDAATGQKLWEWNRAFDPAEATRPHDNHTPRGVTVYYGIDGASTLLVGDFDGRLWELDAATGMNRNYQRGCSGDCNLAAFDTHSTVANPQPITSNIALAKLPATGLSGDFAAFPNETMVLFGTAGASPVGASVTGKVHALVMGEGFRKPLKACVNCTSAVSGTTWADVNAVITDAQSTGTMEEPTDWPKTLQSSERVFGNLTIVGTTAFIPVAYGQTNIEDLANIDPETVGTTYAIDLASFSGTIGNTNKIAGFERANFGGVTVYTWPETGGNVRQSVVGTEITKLARYDTAAHPTGSNPMDKNKDLSTNRGERGVAYRLLNWFRRMVDF